MHPSLEQLLSIETCFGNFSIALFKKGELTDHFASTEHTKQAEQLIPAIENLLAKNGLAYQNLTAIAVCTGPGSFTGLRIGLAAAKGLQLALGIPLIGVTSLEAVIERKNGESACLDASRGDAFFQKNHNSEPELIAYEGEFDATPNAIEIGAVANKNPSNKPALPVYVRKADTKLPHTIKLAKIHAACFPKPWEPHQFERLQYIMSEKAEGFIAYEVLGDECEIKTICVLPSAQRRGIGQLLMSKMLNVTNVKNVFLEVEEGNQPAISLYKKMGFSEFNRRKDYYGPGRHALLMSCKF
jgi:tRNA threonylcarbamoyladenosine biosynthesis protein TsaB